MSIISNASSSRAAASGGPTVVIFLDGLRFTYLNPITTPHLYRLATEGLLANLNTLAGYHVEYSIFSGCYPTRHNVWGWFYYNPRQSYLRWLRPLAPLLAPFDRPPTGRLLRRAISSAAVLLRLARGQTRLIPINMLPLSEAPDYDIAVGRSYIDRDPLPSPTLFDLMRRAGRRYFAAEWPLTATERGTRFDPRGRRDADKLARLAKEATRGHDLVFSHVWELDSKSHAFGIGSPEVEGHIRFLDDAVGRLVADVRRQSKTRLGERPTNVVIFSEHGMVPVERGLDLRLVLAGAGLEVSRDYRAFIGSTMAQIWLHDAAAIAPLKERLRQHPDIEVYDAANIESLHIPYDRDFAGDLLLAVAPGGQFRPNYFQGYELARAMHGYTRKTPDLDSILIVNGPGVAPRRVEDAQLVDIAPTIADLIGLSNAPLNESSLRPWDGRSLLGG